MELNLYCLDTFPKPFDWRLIALNVLSVRETLLKVIYKCVDWHLVPLLLTWVKFYPGTHK